MMKKLAVRRRGPQIMVPVAWGKFLADFKRDDFDLPVPGRGA
jgi:hypothetical protein